MKSEASSCAAWPPFCDSLGLVLRGATRHNSHYFIFVTTFVSHSFRIGRGFVLERAP